MNAREKLIANLCGVGLHKHPHPRDGFLDTALSDLTTEQFALYVEHYVDGRLREAFGLGPLNNPLQHPNCPVCGMQPTMVIDSNQKRRYDCTCGNTWKEPQPPLQDQK